MPQTGEGGSASPSWVRVSTQGPDAHSPARSSALSEISGIASLELSGLSLTRLHLFLSSDAGDYAHDDYGNIDWIDTGHRHWYTCLKAVRAVMTAQWRNIDAAEAMSKGW
jgi:hypothetical protein